MYIPDTANHLYTHILLNFRTSFIFTIRVLKIKIREILNMGAFLTFDSSL